MVQKKNKIDKLLLSPASRITQIKTEITSYFTKTNNPIQHFEDNSGFIVVIPPERIVECNAVINDTVQFDNKDQILTYLKNLEQYKLQSFSMNSEDLLAKHKIPQHSTLVMVGIFMLKSEAPAKCMTYDYQNGIIMNYFSCEECKINWICDACAQCCHKGHQLSMYLTNHKTTWACCYCVSKGLCKALNKNSKH